MAMQLYVIILCTCYVARLQALHMRANESWPYYGWPYAQQLMAKSKTGDACEGTEPLGDRDGYKEFCLCKLVQEMKPTTGIKALFETPIPGFVVSAGPPPDPAQYYEGNGARNAANLQYVEINWMRYWGIHPYGTTSPDDCDGTVNNKACVTAQYSALDADLASLKANLSIENAQPAEGFYEGQGEISRIAGFKTQVQTNKIVSNLLTKYAQDSILLFGGITGMYNKRTIQLQFGTNHHDDAGNYQQAFALGHLQQYPDLQSIPENKRFAYTRVGNQVYAGVVEVTPYVTCTK